MSGVFICYRRDDRPGFAARLAESLEHVFGAGKVFRDVEDIAPGTDFEAVIAERLREVDVVLAVIGPSWLDAGNEGRRRLDDPNDFVRMELVTALAAGKPVWPVLVGGASLPLADALPEDLQLLVRRQAIVLSDTGWRDDVVRLIHALGPLVKVPVGRRRLLLALGGFAALAVIAIVWRTIDRLRSTIDSELVGKWQAQVVYGWGDRYTEYLEFNVVGRAIHGTASFLGVPRIIEEGAIADNGNIFFVTRSETVTGDERRLLTHRYRGSLQGGRLLLVLESLGGFDAYSPVKIEAERQ